MIFSIIVPSFNQAKYIRRTLQNLIELKATVHAYNIEIEILLFDNESSEEVQEIISSFASAIDYVEIKKDKGQYDAINKGILKCKGDYWTWLNTDDSIEIKGFLKLAEILKSKQETDYIYGNINYMDENDTYLFVVKSEPITLQKLTQKNPGVYQPGSFFKKSFTDKMDLLKPYRCCFDYEYILRCIKMNAIVYRCDFPVANFRYYKESKTGSMIPLFIKEQLEISARYGRSMFSYLTVFSYLRLLKHKIFSSK